MQGGDKGGFVCPQPNFLRMPSPHPPDFDKIMIKGEKLFFKFFYVTGVWAKKSLKKSTVTLVQ